MVYDQVTYLMVRAAVTGAIDFSKADAYSSRWMNHLRLVLAEVARQSEVNFLAVLHRHYVAFATIPNQEESSFKKQRDGANSVLELVIRRSEPWNKDLVSRTQKDQAQEAVKEWEDHYGKLDDPEVQAAIDATVAAVQQHRQQQAVKAEVDAAIWKGKRKGTRRERHSASRMGNNKRA